MVIQILAKLLERDAEDLDCTSREIYLDHCRGLRTGRLSLGSDLAPDGAHSVRLHDWWVE